MKTRALHLFLYWAAVASMGLAPLLGPISIGAALFLTTWLVTSKLHHLPVDSLIRSNVNITAKSMMVAPSIMVVVQAMYPDNIFLYATLGTISLGSLIGASLVYVYLTKAKLDVFARETLFFARNAIIVGLASAVVRGKHDANITVILFWLTLVEFAIVFILEWRKPFLFKPHTLVLMTMFAYVVGDATDFIASRTRFLIRVDDTSALTFFFLTLVSLEFLRKLGPAWQRRKRKNNQVILFE